MGAFKIGDMVRHRDGKIGRVVNQSGQAVIVELDEQTQRATHEADLQLLDAIAQPPHYTKHPSGVECIDVAEHFSFCLGNVVKYVWRAGLKGDAIEDLKKAKWYLERELANREKAAN